MRLWSLLVTRSLWVRRVRTLGAILAIALGTGSVIWVTCCYESVRLTINEWAQGYVGKGHVNIEPRLGRYGQFPQAALRLIEQTQDVQHAIPSLTQRLRGVIMPRGYLDANPSARTYTSDHLIPEVDLIGIDAEREPLVRDHQIVAGRALEPDDGPAAVVEAGWAREMQVKVGDVLLVWSYAQPEPFELEIVGLEERRRLARFQKPVALVPLRTVQQITLKYALLSAIDVVLREESPDGATLKQAALAIRRVVTKVTSAVNIKSSAARLDQIERAQSQQELVLVLLSSVAMLTSLFIILTTLSMGMVERIAQLGLLRCVGMTRGQLARLILAEVVPLGALGIALGIPIGLGLTWLSVALLPEYVGSFAISQRGLLLAIGGGALTTLLAGLIPALAATSVAPLEASRPRARKGSHVGIVLAFALGCALLVGQYLIVEQRVQRSLAFVYWATTAVVMLYVGYALLAPIVVRATSRISVGLAAAVMRLRGHLIQDQLGHAVWRSTGICCGMMVGLSLIVGLAVFNDSFKAGWQFPKKFPEAFIWSYEQLPLENSQLAASVPGVKSFTVANAIEAQTVEQLPFVRQLARSMFWFLGCEPESFLDLVQLEFIEGDREDAIEKLCAGGHVLIASDFSRTRDKHLGDEIKVWIGSSPVRRFRVAGVIDSPALDVAASYFQAEAEMRVAAVGSVIGTNDDLRRRFGIDGFRLMLLNFELEDSTVPSNWPPPPDSAAGARLPPIAHDRSLSRDRRWRRVRESDVLNHVREKIRAPFAFPGTVRELKDTIDAELTKMTGLLAAIPFVALLVAAIGVANLMTANVTSRARQLAMMRAVGATQGQLVRMVIGEAIVLGLLGSLLGLSLGLHLAWNINTMTTRMWGFQTPYTIPWGYVLASVAITLTLCIIAGVLPARRAARTNVLDALHVA